MDLAQLLEWLAARDVVWLVAAGFFVLSGGLCFVCYALGRIALSWYFSRYQNKRPPEVSVVKELGKLTAAVGELKQQHEGLAGQLETTTERIGASIRVSEQNSGAIAAIGQRLERLETSVWAVIEGLRSRLGDAEKGLEVVKDRTGGPFRGGGADD